MNRGGIIRGTGIRTNHWVSIASLLTGSLVWGLIWFLYRALSAAGVDGMTATWLTHLLPLVVGAFLFRRKWRQLRSNLGMAMAIGLVAGWCNVAYVLAMLQGQVMQVLLLFYLAPLWTVLFAFVLLGEKPGWAGTLVVLLSSGGAAVMLWQPGAPVPVPATPADWLALSAGLAFVLSNVLSRKASTLDVSAKSLAICCGVTLLAGAALLARAQSVTQWASLSWPDWALLACVGVVIFATNLVVQEGVTRVAANQAIVILLSELLFAAVAAHLLAGERMTVNQFAGGSLIVIATLLSGNLRQPAPSHDG